MAAQRENEAKKRRWPAQRLILEAAFTLLMVGSGAIVLLRQLKMW